MYDVKHVIAAIIIVILILWPILCIFNIEHVKFMYSCYLFVIMPPREWRLIVEICMKFMLMINLLL